MHCINQSTGTGLLSNSGVFSCIATAVSDQLISHAIKHMNTCERTGRFLELTGFERGTGITGLLGKVFPARYSAVNCVVAK